MVYLNFPIIRKVSNIRIHRIFDPRSKFILFIQRHPILN